MFKIHYHSACPFFAGCENMLVNFFSSSAIRSLSEISFSYQYSERYKQGFNDRFSGELPVYPLQFPDFGTSDFSPPFLPRILWRAILAFFRVLSVPLLFLYEVVVMCRLFGRLKPDILHINNGGYPAALSARAAAVAGRLSGVPAVLMVVNNMAADYRRWSRWVDYPLDRMVVRSVDMFLNGSEVAAKRLRSVLRLSVSKSIVIHNGIAVRPPSESVSATRQRLGLTKSSGVVFGMVALLTMRKGHKVLLEAVKLTVEQIGADSVGFVLLIEGSGELKAELQDFVSQNRLERVVRFIGDESHIFDFLNALDVVVLPSIRDEDFPNVILEAMALGKPVIASRLAGISQQVLGEKTGILVDPGDIGSLVNALCRFRDDESLRMAMGSAGKTRFEEQFTADASVRKYCALYQQLIDMKVCGKS